MNLVILPLMVAAASAAAVDEQAVGLQETDRTGKRESCHRSFDLT